MKLMVTLVQQTKTNYHTKHYPRTSPFFVY